MAEFWSNNDRGYRLRLWLDQVSQNIAGNTSQVRVRLSLLNGTTTFAGYTFSGTVTVDGQRLSYSSQPSMTSYNQSISLIDQTVTIAHGADGKKSVGFSANFSGSGGYSPGMLSLSGNFGLTTIPRTSSFSGQTVAVGSNMSININRASSSFTHTLRYGFGSKSGTIATGVATSTTWAVPINFAEEIPNGTSAQGTIWCDTYSGNTKIGTSHYIFTVTVPDTIKPTFTGITLSDANTAAQSLIPGNTFIQVVSNIKVAFSGASGSYGSSITGYKAEIVGKNQSTNVNGGSLGIMNYNGSITIRASVSDSRGRWSDTKDVSVTVLEYFAPALSFSIARTGSSSSTFTVTRNAKVAPLTVGGAQKNTMKLSFKVASIGSTSYTADTGAAAGYWSSLSSLTNSQANLAGSYVANQSWTVIGTLEDKFTRTEFAMNVATESVVFSYDRSGVGVNKVRERGALDVNGEAYFSSHIYGKNGTPIGHYSRGPAVADLNDIITAGFHTFYDKTLNQPNSRKTWGVLEVVVSSDSVHNGTNNWIWQTYISTEGAIFKRYRINAGNWSQWVSPALDQYYPIGAIYQSTSPANPATFMGGTWERFGNGKFLVGVDEIDSDFNAPSKTGGNKIIQGLRIVAKQFGFAASSSYGGRGIVANSSNQGTVDSAFNVNNLPPYIAVYMWRRTA